MQTTSYENQPINFYEEPEEVFSMNPKKFMLWLFVVSITMIFASLTSAYIYKQSDKDSWITFDLPEVLLYSTIVIVVSSVFMQLSYFFAKKDELGKLKINLLITAILGVAFLVLQWEGWVKLVEMGIFVGGVDRMGNPVSPAGSFVYVLMGLHAFHLITGLIFLLIVTWNAFRYKVHRKAMLQIELCNIYWHFLGGLWVYLYLFMSLNR
ncbi:MAG: cytochrome c oxidase subunit 3 [Raineya sp.]|nr:cytochrome c oxidase subunit 3 [Raineya sp.]